MASTSVSQSSLYHLMVTNNPAMVPSIEETSPSRSSSDSYLKPELTSNNAEENNLNFDKSDENELDKNLRIAFTEAQIVYMLIGVVGVIGNSLSVAVVLRSKTLKKVLTNYFLINQSMIDLVASIGLLATIPVGNSQSKLQGVSGYVRCVFFDSSLPVWATFLSSSYNLVALTIERWLQVTRPLQHKANFTHKMACIIMAGAWVTGFIYEAALAVATSAVIDGECFALAIWRSQRAKHIYGIITFITKYLAPILIIIYCYSSMVKSLRVDTSVGNNHRQQKMKKVQKNILKTLLVVVVCFILCVTYNQVLFLFFNLGFYPIDFTSFMYHLSVALYFLNCCINPFIYIIKYNDFRQSFFNLFRRNNQVGDVPTVTGVTQASRTHPWAAVSKPGPFSVHGQSSTNLCRLQAVINTC